MLDRTGVHSVHFLEFGYWLGLRVWNEWEELNEVSIG